MPCTYQSGPVAIVISLLILTSAIGDVRINEFGAVSTDRLLRWDSNGVPHLGAGTSWWEPDFDDGPWPTGMAPLGFNYPEIVTDLSTEMFGLTPSLYLRKSFTVNATQASSTADLFLDVDFDDGFIAYLNGVEIRRANMGPPKGFVYADQPSYNGNAWTGNQTFTVGKVNERLLEGENVLTIQVHNASLTSGAMILDAGLRKTDGGAVQFVAKGSDWRYFIGRVEPSGGVFDTAFLPEGGVFKPDWARPAFDDSTWDTGAGPLGFDAAVHYPLGTDLDGMRNNQSVLYTRKTFQLTAPQLASITTVDLTVDYDDGFVAFLNGTEIARENLGPPGLFVPFDATASGVDNASMDSGGNNPALIVTIPVDASLLREGDNVLAIQMCNNTLGSSDLMVISDLTTNGGSGRTLVNSTDLHRYFIGTEEPSTVEDNSEAAVPPQFVDWIELHNDGAQPVDLTGWSLSDDDDETDKWTFPDGTTIEAGGYLLVLADGVEPEEGQTTFLHANFKLSGGGEFLALYDDLGNVRTAFDPEYPDQYDFHSYGVDPGGGTDFGYLAHPTPGAPNTGPFLSGRAKSPDFSVAGGFHNAPVSLALTSETPGATIRYTTDGSEPTDSNGSVYSGPIALAPINDKTGHVIRARSFGAGLIPSRVKTHTYLLNQHPNLQTAPALIFTGDDARTFYKEHGIMAIEGGTYVNGRWQSNGIDSYNIPYNRGRAYERPFHLELLYGDGREGIREDAGIRISSSNYSRPRLRLTNTAASPWTSTHTEKPSFNLFFRGDYGADRIKYQWIREGYSVDHFEQLRIRAGKNDIRNPFIVDEVVRRLYSDMGQASSNGIISTMYINGVFKGFFNMTERLREPFFQQHHDSDGDWDVRQVRDFADGDSTAWNEMIALLQKDLTVLANYEAVQQVLDVENFIDYLLVNIYGATRDWPQNNWVAARERSEKGLWRFYVWDAEMSYGFGNRPTGYDTIQTDLLNKNNEIPTIYKYLRNSPEFRLHWADRVQKHYFNGGPLDDRDQSNSNVRKHWDELSEKFQPLLSYVHNQTIALSRITNWTNPSSGKRSHLFGPNNTQFANHGLWPDLRPPVFSRHGGEVDNGHLLTITHSGPSGARIYYTTDGTDPRLPGGAVAPGTQTYQSGFGLYNLETAVAARVFLPSTGEWSALNEAVFSVGIAPIRINEVIIHTDLPEIDSIELYNPTPVPVNLRGWSLTDDPSRPRKYVIPNGVTIPAEGYLVFDETDFFTGPDAFRLSEYGEPVYLFSGNFNGELTGYSHGWDVRAAPNGVTTGRYVDSQGKVHFVLQAENTLGAANGLPRVGPVIISEIHYRPPDLEGGIDNSDDEFIELTNLSNAVVPLHGTDTSVPGYGNAALNDTWQLRNAVDFDFPPGVELQPGQRILVVGFDPSTETARLASFRAKYNIAPSIEVYGPWSGKLDNSGEEIELKYPGSADPLETFFVPYYIAEEIDYRDNTPWPPEADGLGSSLQRVAFDEFGNDPLNWIADTPQKGAGRDTDDDGMEDWWERLHGLVVGIDDAALDLDLDGQSNLDEFRARTSPGDGSSLIKVVILPTASGHELSFTAMPDVAYWIQYSDGINPPVWMDLHEVPAGANEREIRFSIPATGTRNFYRVIIPATD